MLLFLPIAILLIGVPAQARDDAETKAIARFRQALEKNPRRDSALDRVYGYYAERGTLGELIESYRERTRKDPRDGATWQILGLIELQRGREAEALGPLEQAEKLRPSDPLASYYLGQALIAVGRPSDAAAAFERALVRKPGRDDLAAIARSLGRLHLRAGRIDRAIAVYERLEKALPDDSRAKEQVAELLAEEGASGEALKRYEWLAEHDRDPNRRIGFRFEAAALKTKLGPAQEAIAAYEKILDLVNPESGLDRDARDKLEGVFLKNDDLQGLITYYEKWIRNHPDDLEAMLRSARAFSRLGKGDSAREALTNLVKKAPSRADARRALIEHLVNEGGIDEALVQYERLAELDHDAPDTVRAWGRLALRAPGKSEAERRDSAKRVWNKLIEAKPKDALAYVQVADLLREAGAVDEALDHYRRAAELAGDATQFLEYWGAYLFDLKREPEAIEVWKRMAAGARRSERTLVRLAEVLAANRKWDEAIAAARDAQTLAPDSFETAYLTCEIVFKSGRYDEALAELERVGKLAVEPAEKARVLDLETECRFYRGNLAADIAELEGRLKANADAPASAKLAHLQLFARLYDRAAASARAALAGDPSSAPAERTLAAALEFSGNLAEAGEAYAKLADLDPRSRSEALETAARIDLKLGKLDRAKECVRKLIDQAPLRRDYRELYASFCIQGGDVEEGLRTLRESAVAHPDEPEALLVLADALAHAYRFDEQGEILWRAFDKTRDLDDRLAIVAGLADLSLGRNRFDALLARLERELARDDQAREHRLALAQAYTTAREYGSARQALEPLLDANPTDAQVLARLEGLAESEDDYAAAAEYQRRLFGADPSPSGKYQLARLYVKSGDLDRAEAIIDELVSRERIPVRITEVIDELMRLRRFDRAAEVGERSLRNGRGDWEILYRLATALRRANRHDEAEARFRELLDLRIDDDRLSERKAVPSSRALSVAVIQKLMPMQDKPTDELTLAVSRIQQATRLMSGPRDGLYFDFEPRTFGEARMASLAFLEVMGLESGRGDEVIAGLRRRAAAEPKNPRVQADRFYLESVLGERSRAFEAVSAWVKAAPRDSLALCLSLEGLAGRGGGLQRRGSWETTLDADDALPPLTDSELEEILSSYRTLKAIKPERLWPELALYVDHELARAGKTELRESFYREVMAEAAEPRGLVRAGILAGERGRVDDALRLFERIEATPAALDHVDRGAVVGGAEVLCRAMNACAEERRYDDLPAILDGMMRVERRPGVDDRRLKRKSFRTMLASAGLSSLGYAKAFVGNEIRPDRLAFPELSAEIDLGESHCLWNAFVLLTRDRKLETLLAHYENLRRSDSKSERIHAGCVLACLYFWNDDREAAIAAMAGATAESGASPDLLLMQGRLLDLCEKHEPALAVLDRIEPGDARMLEERELAAIRLAATTGDVVRARLAAERLFGLRLHLANEVRLASQMRQLGMNELADTVRTRIDLRKGKDLESLRYILNDLIARRRVEEACVVAREIVRKTAGFVLSIEQNSNEIAVREVAVRTLSQAGKLDELIAQTQKQSLAGSERSAQLALENLFDLQLGSSRRAESLLTAERIVALKPADPLLKLAIGGKLAMAGMSKEASAQVLAALKAEPRLAVSHSGQVIGALRTEGRMNDVVKVLDTLPIRLAGPAFIFMRVLEPLARSRESAAAARELTFKFWEAHPEETGTILGLFVGPDVLRDPRAYELLCRSLFPRSGRPVASAWWGFHEDFVAIDDQGNLVTPMNRLVETAKTLGKVDDLASRVEAAVQLQPRWSAGKALLAIVESERGRPERANALIRDLLADANRRFPQPGLMAIARAFGGRAETRGSEIALYERAVTSVESRRTRNYTLGPARLLALAYAAEGAFAKARKPAWDYTTRTVVGGNNQVIESSTIGLNRVAPAMDLRSMGFPGDAARVFASTLADAGHLGAADREHLDSEYTLRTDVTQQPVGLPILLRRGLEQAIREFESTVDARQLDAWLAEGSAIDPAIIADPPEFDRVSLRSLWLELARRVDASAFDRIERRLEELGREMPNDFAIAVVQALTACARGSREAKASSVKRLAGLIKQSPLPGLAELSKVPAGRGGAIDTALACRVIAREIRGESGLTAERDILEARALEAAAACEHRHLKAAILRERLERLWESNDPAAAQSAWSVLAAIVLPEPEPTRAAKSALVAVSPARLRDCVQLARFAIEHNRPESACRLIARALGDGPPIEPEFARNGSLLRDFNGRAFRAGMTAPDREAAERIVDLDDRLTAAKAPALEAYRAWKAIVLPDSRPDELFVYPCPLPPAGGEFLRTLVQRLVARALEANQDGDLTRACDDRSQRPRAKFAAELVRFELARARHESDSAKRSLESLAQSLAKSPSPADADLLAYAALEALGVPDLRNSALFAAEAAATGLERAASGDTLSALATELVRDAYAHAETIQARAWLEVKSKALEKLVAGGRSFETARIRKRAYAAVAQEAARARDLALLLDYLGRLADTPSPNEDDPPLGPCPEVLDELLAALPPNQRYETLSSWILPTEKRASVRSLAAPLSGWSTIGRLVAAAQAAGKLDELAGRLEAAALRHAVNAEPAIALTAIAQGKGADVRGRISASFARARAIPAARGEAALVPCPMTDFMVARACLSDPDMRSEGKAFLKAILKDELRYPRHFVAAARRELEEPARSPGASVREFPTNAWVPVTQKLRSDQLTGTAPARWSVEENRIVHRAGSGRDLLFFACPLEGSFEITLESSAALNNSGRVAYAGLVFEPTIPGPRNVSEYRRRRMGDMTPTWPNGPSRVSSLSAHESSVRPAPSLKSEGYNSFRIAVEPKHLRMYVNDHLYYEERGPIASPWFALAGFLGGRAEFRSLKISGAPRVPGEVSLISGDRLAGWSSAELAESMPDRLTNASVFWIEPDWVGLEPGRVAPGTPDEERNWFVREGEIVGKKRLSPRQIDGTPSLLRYVRPLRVGETLAYEFYYAPGQWLVEPALGEDVFVLEAPDVKVEKLGSVHVRSRSHPHPLLKPNAWNAIELTYRSERIIIKLNGEVIADRSWPAARDATFGLYHDRDRTGARVRNAVLKGAWPTNPGAEGIQRLLSVSP